MIILLLLPAIVLIILIFCVPLIRYLWLSLHASSVVTGLEALPNYGANWFRLINDDRFWQDALQTSRFATLSVSLEIVLAFAIALLLDQRFRARGSIRVISLLPWALPTTVMALGWRWIFNSPYGPIDQLLILFNSNIESSNFLSNPDIAWITTVVADVWKTTPFVALILLAGLQTIPNDLYEAFRLEGGTKRQAIFRITIPLLKPYFLISIIFRLAQAFGVFDLIQVMTGGGPAGSTESLAMYAYINAMRFLDFGYSSTIMIASFILLVAAGTISFLLINFFRKVIY